MQPYASPPAAPPAEEPSEQMQGSAGEPEEFAEGAPLQMPDAHVSSPVPPSSSASDTFVSGVTAASPSSTAVAVEDPTPVPSSSGDTAAGTSSAAVAAEDPPPAPSASDVKIPEPAPGAPNYARSQS